MARHALALLVVLLCPALVAAPATAASGTTAHPARVHAIGGGVETSGEASWSFAATFEQELTDLLAFEVGYFNEGHPDPAPHRDGFAVQLFAAAHPFAAVADGDATTWLAERLRIRAGAGPSIDFNTVQSGGQIPRELTRAGFLFTAAIDLRLTDQLAIGPRVVEHVGIDSHDSLVVGLDVSWLLPAPPTGDRPQFGVVAASGKSKRNAQGGSGVPVWAGVERNSLFGSDELAVSAAYLGIGGPNDRRGVALGVDAEQRFGDDGALGLGAGLGPYFYDDGKDSGQDPSGVTALIRTRASYRLWRGWRLVAMFLREAGSPEQQNYDVFLGGIDYEFDLPAPDDDEPDGP